MNEAMNESRQMYKTGDTAGLIPRAQTAPTYVYRSGHHRVFITGDHAGRWDPEGILGLDAQEMSRHIGWDIGIAGVCAVLADLVEAPMILSRYSRLVVDLNRREDIPACIPEVSDGTVVPGNQGLSPRTRADRLARCHAPYHEGLAEHLSASGSDMILALHSFTPQRRTDSTPRPWHCGMMYGAALELGQACVEFFRRESGLIVGDQAPYQVQDDDYTVPIHGDEAGRPAVALEIRQDLIAERAGQEAWAHRVAALLAFMASV
ncbi:MAG: N-formylglutamate amidohydrolase [Pseudomonadota bacterium]